MRSLTRVLRLAGVLSASPCSASLSASSRHPSKSTNSMAARISTSSSAAAALSRARLIRSRPGFVPAITTTSTRRPATTTRATGRQQRAFAVASTAIARRQRLRNGASSSTSAAALERWFVPGTPSARSPRRLFSTAPAEVSTAGNRGEEEEVVDGAAPFKVSWSPLLRDKELQHRTAVVFGMPVMDSRFAACGDGCSWFGGVWRCFRWTPSLPLKPRKQFECHTAVQEVSSTRKGMRALEGYLIPATCPAWLFVTAII